MGVCVCETCKEFLKNESDLEKHIKDHHTRPCITCDLDFKMVSDLREHMKISHGPQCNLCSNSFDTNEELVKHTAEKQSSKPSTKYNCNECQLSFNSNEELGNHTHESHMIECNLYKTQVSVKDGLEQHVLSVHSPARITMPSQLIRLKNMLSLILVAFV